MPRSTRRTFLGATLGAGLTAPLVTAARVARRPLDVGRAGEPLKLLILGGTGFLGPAIVEHAVARGHSMTLFNRGRTHADLFPDLEKLRGDRNTGDLAALEDREFDAVIDTSGYVPGHVTATAGMLAEKARQYVFVSSISVYPAFGEKAGTLDEDAELATVPDDVIAKVKTIQESFVDGGKYYGGFKALCEQAAEDAMPGRVTNVRPGLIVGPRDNSDRFTWWPVRVDRGGEVLAPGDPDASVQFIDVRDLAAFIVHCIEEGVVGRYNATGFRGIVTMEQLLHGCRCATANPVELTWVAEDFLQEQGVGPWMQMPLWLPAAGNTQANVERALANGLALRPVADTVRDTLAWAKEEAKSRQMFRRTGLSEERERAVLEAWHASRKDR